MAVDNTKIDADMDRQIANIAEFALCLRWILETYASGGKQAFKDLPDQVRKFYQVTDAILTDVEKFKVK